MSCTNRRILPYSCSLFSCLLGWLFASIVQAQTLPAYKAGFPLSIPADGTGAGQPLLVDLGLTPGFKSIVFGTFRASTSTRKLHILKRAEPSSWVEHTGWPVTLPGHPAASPAVADLSNPPDGIPEIVIGYGSTLDPTGAGGVKAFRLDGTTLWTVTPLDVVEGANGLPDPVQSTPAIGDVDGDGRPDVAFGSFDFRVYLVDGATGAAKAGWPKDVRDTVFSSPALHDLDGDGRLDIIIGVDAHAEGPPFNTPDGGCLHAFRFDGTEIAGFPKCVNQVIWSSPAVGDIDGDGRPEIVHGTGTFYQPPTYNPTHAVYAWNCDGTAVAGWPVLVDGQVSTGPALADITGDGVLDVLVTSDNTGPSGTFHLNAFRGDGTQIFSPRVPKGYFGETLSAGEPIVANVLSNPGLEILLPQNTEVVVFSAAGTQLTEDGPPRDPAKLSFLTQTSLGNVAVADIETDAAGSQIEVLAVSAEPFPDATNTHVHVWNPVAATSTPPWGFFHQNAQRSGVAPATGSCHGPCATDPLGKSLFTLTPCRLADTRLAAGPYGGPPLASGALRDFALTGTGIGPGSCTIPASARAVSLNVTAVGATGPGFVRFSPGCLPLPVSTINFSTGQTRANNLVMGLGAGGILTANAVISGGGSVHLIIDINGYFE